MSIRALLFILFTASLVLILGFIAFALNILWLLLGDALPATTSFFGQVISTSRLLVLLGATLSALIALLFVFFYLFIDHLVVVPLKHIAAALHEFAEQNQQEDLPKYSRTTNEVSWLADMFTAFTANAGKVHARDMEVSRMKSDFISTAAHQLRTPMTGIRWALEALQKSGLTPDQQALVDSAVGKSHDLVTITGTLLDISSIESGKYKYKFEAVDMGPVVESIITGFTQLAQTRQVNLYYAKSDTVLPKVRADKERIKWVLNNLVENAIRYTPAGGSIQLFITVGMGRLFIHVQDTGIGIQAGDRTSIFERFYRAQNAIQKENSGNGLGLYIARTIATDHGGDLNFEANKDGPGTTFTLSLQVAN